MQIVVSLIDAVFDRIKPITLPDRHVQPVVTVSPGLNRCLGVKGVIVDFDSEQKTLLGYNRGSF